jgi:hypothetical protein
VSRAYRGASDSDFEVVTGEGNGDCGYSFVVGQQYLIYAHRVAGGKRLTTGICSLTKPLAAAREDLEYLDSLNTRPAGTSVRGRVRQNEVASGGEHEPISLAAAGFLVRLSSDTAAFEAISDESGAFALAGLPPGKYLATVVVQPPFTTAFDAYEFELPDPRACVELPLSVQFDGRLEGRLVGPDGAAIGDTLVRLHWAEVVDFRSYIDAKRTDASGRFSFGPLSPGHYRLEVGVERMSDDDIPYPPTWYPGVAYREESTPVEIGPGQHVLLDPFRVPQRLRRIVVKGRVTWPPAFRMGEVSVDVYDAGSEHQLTAGERVRPDGTFEFTLNEGRRYVIRARSDIPGTRQFRAAESEVIEPSDRTPEVILTFVP